MNRKSILFVTVTYFLTFISVYTLPSNIFYYSLITLIPGLVSILLTTYDKQDISGLFKKCSAKYLLQSIVIPLMVIPSIFGLSWLFSLVEYTTKNVEAINTDNKAFVLITMLVLSYVVSVATSISSEISWRGYLLKNIKGQVSNFYIRVFLVSLICAIWSVIVFAFNPLLFTYKEHISLSLVCMNFFQIFFLSMIYSWLFERNNSIWPGILASNLFFTLIVSFGFFVKLDTLLSIGFSSLSMAISFFTVACIFSIDRQTISKIT